MEKKDRSKCQVFKSEHLNKNQQMMSPKNNNISIYGYWQWTWEFLMTTEDNKVTQSNSRKKNSIMWLETRRIGGVRFFEIGSFDIH